MSGPIDGDGTRVSGENIARELERWSSKGAGGKRSGIVGGLFVIQRTHAEEVGGVGIQARESQSGLA